MNRGKIAGTILIITGCLLTMIGITLLFVKGNSMVPFISVPVIFFGILIWHGAESKSSAMSEKLKDL